MKFLQQIPEILSAVKELDMSELGTIFVIAILIIAIAIVTHKKMNGSPPDEKKASTNDDTNTSTSIIIKFERKTKKR